MAATTSDGQQERAEELGTYVRTVVVPIKHLTNRKRGLLNRQMKHALRAARSTAEKLQQSDTDAYDVGYSQRNKWRKEIRRQSDVKLGAQSIQCLMKEVLQNYEEFDKDPSATEPWPEAADVVHYSAQQAYLFHDNGWYVCLPAVNGDLILPLRVSEDAYHQEVFPDPDAAPDQGRRPGVKLEDFDAGDFSSRVVKLGQCSVLKRETGFELHLSVTYQKHVNRDVTDPRYVVGIDRGRNELFYGALFDRETDHVIDWEHLGGDAVEDTMDKLAERISAVQEEKALDQMINLRTRRRRFKRQKDFEAANEIVRLARRARNHGQLNGQSVVIVLEDLSGMSGLGNYSRENRRFNEWSYYRLQQAIEDKAEPYDIPVQTIDPEFTSQDCSRCGSDDSARSGVYFECDACGYQHHADANAAVNIAKRFDAV